MRLASVENFGGSCLPNKCLQKIFLKDFVIELNNLFLFTLRDLAKAIDHASGLFENFKYHF